MTLHGKQKLDYSTWIIATNLIDQLQSYGHSLSEISRLITGTGDTPGWAANARHHRGIVRPEHFDKLEQLVASCNGDSPTPLPEKEEPDMPDRRQSLAQANRYRQLIYWLKEDHGWSQARVARAVGLSQAAISRVLVNTEARGMVSNLTKLQEVVDGVKRKQAEIRSGVKPEPAEEKAPPRPEQEQVTAEELVRRRRLRDSQVEEEAKNEEWDSGAPDLDPVDEPTPTEVSFESESLEVHIEAVREVVNTLLERLEILGAAAPPFIAKAAQEWHDRVRGIREELGDE